MLDRFLEYLGPGGTDPLEKPIQISGAEDRHRQHAFGEQLLNSVPVGFRTAGMGIREHDAQPRLGIRAKRHPTVFTRSDIVDHFQAQTVTVERDGLVDVVDGDV